jgi:predicted SPOUT superfamily RNA methylase MTH1
VWTVSVDPGAAARLQATATVSGMVADGRRVTVRIVSRTPPAGARPVEPTLEDAYLLTVGAAAAA